MRRARVLFFAIALGFAAHARAEEVSRPEDPPPVEVEGASTDANPPEAETPDAVVAAVEATPPALDPSSASATDPADPAVPPEPPPEPLGVFIDLYDPSGKALDPLYHALRRAELGESKARLLFYGASHTAMDDYTGHLRARLQARFGDGGPGFVLPVQPFRWYAHKRIRIRSTGEWKTYVVTDEQREREMYGLAGYAVETVQRGARGIVEPKDRKEIVSRFELYYLEQPGGGRFDLYVDGRRVQRVSTAAEVRQAAYAAISVKPGFHRFEVRSLGGGPVRLFGVVLENESKGVVVEPVGVSGSRARDQLPWDETIRGEHLRHRQPNLVVLAYGTNESTDTHLPIAATESHLNKVLGRIRDALPSAACMLIGPSDRPIAGPEGSFEERERTAKVIDVTRRTAANHGCAFFDLVAFMGGTLTMPAWVTAKPPLARDDYVHFTDLGHQRLAEVLEAAMLRRYSRSRIDREVRLAKRKAAGASPIGAENATQ